MTKTGIQAVAGVWRREWEEDPIGDSANADRDTLVLWIQTPSGVYVDFRLPSDAPGRSLEAARKAGFQQSPDAVAASGIGHPDTKISTEVFDSLCRQKSFAGNLEYSVGDTTNGQALKEDGVLNKLAAQKGDGRLELCTCFWRRHIDYQPPSGGLDIGVCASEIPSPDGSVRLRETGDDASYAEGWYRLPNTSEGPFMALRLVSENNECREGYWVRAGKYFSYAVGRPTTAEMGVKLGCHPRSHAIRNREGMKLDQAVQNEPEEDRLLVIGSYLFVSGEVLNDGDWRIDYSSHPSLVGCYLLSNTNASLQCSTVQPVKADSLGKGSKIKQVLSSLGSMTVREWEVQEIEGAVL